MGVRVEKQDKRNFLGKLKVGIPYTLVGMAVVFGGIYLLKHLFGESDHLLIFMILWVALFWFIYQPLFRRKIRGVDKKTKNSKKRGS